jgi:hypothetical protein
VYLRVPGCADVEGKGPVKLDIVWSNLRVTRASSGGTGSMCAVQAHDMLTLAVSGHPHHCIYLMQAPNR